ncbi:hypothetical protein CASFOL_026792 [Castilleja foliolosa]|uniref:Uncharacterized protein n=1 Tax=Castilleja foliolosa TaxID=1961234 RepID=A0ABD3CI28_9LAMI
MDCDVPIDDIYDVYEGHNLEIPETIPSTCANADQCFFIKLEVELTWPVDDDEFGTVHHVGTDSYEYWAPCLKTEHENLAKDEITSMLTKAGIPKHKQDEMVDSISWDVDRIAKSPYNKDVRVLPILVNISIIACWCYCQ